MSKTNYSWQKAAPPKPDVYTTRRNESKYLPLRYWDGERWFEIAWGPSRGGIPFKWPKPSRTKRPSWAVDRPDALRLRNISTYLGEIQWGEPFKVFGEYETLDYLVKSGVLPADWRVAYQQEMRDAK